MRVRHESRALEAGSLAAAQLLDRVEITRTDSQLGQLEAYRYEKKGDGLSVLLCANPNLGSGYIEAILLDADGEPTADKRVLFPT
jgi:hypothetical protein